MTANRRQPNLHVSAGLARLTDQQAEVIATRRQDNLFLGKLVVDYLTEYGSATRPAIDELLRAKVGGGLTASQVTRQIAHLLTVMRREGQIKVDRPGPGGIWSLVEPEKDHGPASAPSARGSSGSVRAKKNADGKENIS